MQKIFLSHNSKDKPFIRQLAADLKSFGLESWVDEAEIDFGESLIKKIVDSIERVSLVIIVISRHSIVSNWVQKELEMSMLLEIEGRRNFVVPMVIDDAEVPLILRTKRYLDCTTPKKYKLNIGTFVERISTDNKPEYLMAGQAFDLLKSKCQAEGSVISISHQGLTQAVATEHFLLKNLIYRNAYAGASRFWVFEFFLPADNLIQTLAVSDGEIIKLNSSAIDGWATDEQMQQVKFTTNITAPDRGKKEKICYRTTTYRPKASVSKFPDSQFICEMVYQSHPDLYEQLERQGFLLMNFYFHDRLEQFIWTMEYFDAFSSHAVYRFDCDLHGNVIWHGHPNTTVSINQNTVHFSFNAEGDIEGKLSGNLVNQVNQRNIQG